MKNSVWYHKLWREKLNKLEIKESSDAAWEGMKSALDQYIPADVPLAGGSAVSVASKIWKLIGYIVPTVAVISTVAYVYVSEKKESKSVPKKTKEIYADSVVNKIYTEDERNKTEADKNSDVNRSQIPHYNTLNNESGLESSKPLSLKSSLSDMYNNVPEEYNNPGDMAAPFSQRDHIVQTDNSILFNHPQTGVVYNRQTGATPGNSLSGSNLDLRYSTQRGREPVLITDYSKKEQEKERRGAKENRKNTIYYTSPGNNKQIKFENSGLVWNPSYNFGLETGANIGTQGTNLYAGVFGQIAFNNKWAVSLGLNVNSNRKVSGEFSHPSYFRPDSLGYSFMIRDSRKLAAIDIPLKVEYRLSDHILLNTGVIIDLPFKQSSKITGLGPVYDVRDTLRHSQEINSALTNTNANKVNIGLSGGVTLHLRGFDIKGSYQLFNPYRVSNALGSYKTNNGFFRVGVGYRFK
ncbi:hypothetical protein HMPREF0765_1032 [Sphingobacterium spiritivorum ATCC 33300]|uniref:Outer membrane protein beta-barrel domain-containing protein n=1 Tax=Sphingobacterium spiritivorum ATCC 33300 TaxID=525372 RepID=C2FUM6_SPHSI|nr:hypothetical protein [Sphingobacterium spiritivorum]EEI93359.1 hypothetical protein HMPREF0765_1032 [Sphingobacterium spiritivorum ATCC 33300]QQS95935.1 hypothetical protein I6J03_21605 [Sphingobacterium spiritivorum]